MAKANVTINSMVALTGNSKMRTGLSRGTLNSKEQANPELAGTEMFWASVETITPCTLVKGRRESPILHESGENTKHRSTNGFRPEPPLGVILVAKSPNSRKPKLKSKVISS